MDANLTAMIEFMSQPYPEEEWDKNKRLEQQAERINALEAANAVMQERIAELEDALRRIVQLENDSDTSDLVVLRKALRIAIDALGDRPSTRITELEAQLATARANLARYVAGIDAERESGRQVLTRLLALVEEWERADCRSSTYDCAEQVRAILRGEGPQGWEMRAGKEGGE